MDSRPILTIVSVATLFLASGCSGGAGGGGAAANGSQAANSTGGASGATSPPSTTNGAACPSADQVVASADGYVSALTIAGSYVYLEQRPNGTDGNPSPGQGPSFIRVPISGGAVETLDGEGAAVFAANDAGVVVWTPANRTDSGELRLLDKSGQRTLSLPPNASSGINALAVDAAGNVFVLAYASTGGNDVYRYSAVRQTFDMLHHNIAGLQGFYKDGKGVAWIGPGEDGTPALYHEDVLGGAPGIGPSLANASQIAGIDDKAVYLLEGLTISAIDRASGNKSVALDMTSDSAPSSYVSAVASDDANFYWVARDSDGASTSIFRASKHDGSPTPVASGDKIGSIALGSCSIAYLTGGDDGTFSVVSRPK